jgi:guanylate kinase
MPEDERGKTDLRATSGAPVLLVISGPSGVGKDAVIAGLKKALSSAHFVTTATTRPPRPGERDGVDYHFLTDRQYDDLIAEDGFLEHASVYNQRSGVPRSEVEEPMAKGQDVIVRVDVQGAATIKRVIPDAVLVFLAPASPGELQQRLRERATDDGADLRLRLKTASQEMARERAFDYVVVNADGSLDEAVSQIVAIMGAEKRKRARP